MLVRLLPEQISNYWDYVKYAIQQTEIDVSQETINNILQALLAGGMHCWWYVIDEETEPKVLAQIITTIFEDKSLDEKTLRIFSLFGYEGLTNRIILDGFETLRRYAQVAGCKYIDAYTSSEPLVHLANRYGFSTSLTYIRRSI